MNHASTTTRAAGLSATIVGLLAALSAGSAEAQSCIEFGTFHLVSTPVPATPAGELMQPNPTGASGFFPTKVITPSGAIWYTEPLTGTFNAGGYNLVLWTNTPGGSGASLVSAQLGLSNADGSGFGPIVASAIVDVKSTGTGNHITNLALPVSGTITLTNQRLIVKVFSSGGGGAAPTMVYNGGVDFDTRLVTAGGCAQPALGLPTTLHLVDPAVSGVSPAGKLMQLASTNASGFFPTVPLNATVRHWYSPVVHGSLPASSFTVVLWTNSPGAASNVTVKVDRTNASGSGAVTLVPSATRDVNASGTGNHTTTFGPFAVPATTLSGHRLRLSINGPSSGAQAVMVYNGGVDFDTRLTITPPPTTTVIPVLKDAGLSGNQPGANFGGDPGITVSAGASARGLLGYSLSAIPATATVTRASLRMPHVALISSSLNATTNLVASSAAWTEAAVTWNNQPGITTPPLTGFFVLQNPSAVAQDVTAAVQAAVRASGPREISFRIDPVSGGGVISAKEGPAGQATSLEVQWF